MVRWHSRHMSLLMMLLLLNLTISKEASETLTCWHQAVLPLTILQEIRVQVWWHSADIMVVGALVRSMHRIHLRDTQWIEHIAVVFVVKQIVRQPVLRVLARVHHSAELWVIVFIALFLFICLFDIDRVGDVLRCLAVWSYRRLLAILSNYIGRTSHICLWCCFEWANLRRLGLHDLTMCRLIDNDSRWVRWGISTKELCKISNRRLLLCDDSSYSLLLMSYTSCLLLLIGMLA